jgi:hypothetical protein
MMGSVLRFAASGTGCFQAAVETGCRHATAVGTSCRFTGSLAPAKPVITIPVKVRQEIQDMSGHQSTHYTVFEIQKTVCRSDGSETGLTISLLDPASGKERKQSNFETTMLKRQCCGSDPGFGNFLAPGAPSGIIYFGITDPKPIFQRASRDNFLGVKNI